MKYMGSKKAMLKNGLGSLILEQTKESNRFFDPFCGSSSVAWYVAENTNNEVIAGDLQQYSVVLANSVLPRDFILQKSEIEILFKWINDARIEYSKYIVSFEEPVSIEFVHKNRRLAALSKHNITKAYGGYYFSYNQALCFDILLNSIPETSNLKYISLASLIEAASQCVASPGHTAQPFSPTSKGLKYILESWKRDPFEYVTRTIEFLSNKHSNTIGHGYVAEAMSLLNNFLNEDDLVFLDPPYSGVHYSRFYHVLETIARNQKIEATGKGRYPAFSERPRSDYSLKGNSAKALEQVFQLIADRKAKAIITFPANKCSNGLSGDLVKEIAKQYFKVEKELIKGTFSTLGGNNSHRPARQASSELVLLLTQM